MTTCKNHKYLTEAIRPTSQTPVYSSSPSFPKFNTPKECITTIRLLTCLESVDIVLKTISSFFIASKEGDKRKDKEKQGEERKEKETRERERKGQKQIH